MPFSVIRGMRSTSRDRSSCRSSPDPSIRSITPNGASSGQSVASGVLWPLAADVTTLRGLASRRRLRRPRSPSVDSGIDTLASGTTSASRIHGTVDFTGDDGAAGQRRQRPRHDGRGHRGRVVAALPRRVADVGHLLPQASFARDGSAYTGDVIAAADWIYTHAFSNNIRVANFSLRSSFPNYACYDPLDAAVRRLWLTGTVVVASAGNDGNGRMLYAPANDPFVITVGASDIADTVDAHATTPTHPGRPTATPPRASRSPSSARPGRWMIAPVPAVSTLAKTFPDRLVAPGYMWMSGTSFSAPVVSGLAAQILARHPASRRIRSRAR